MKKANAASIVEQLRKSNVAKVKVAVSDIDGILRGKYINGDKFFSAVEGGFGFCDVVFGWDAHDQCYDNTELTGWHHGFPDAMVRLDLDTYRTVPWDNGVPFFLGNFVTAKGDPHPVCPRQVLKRVLKRAEKMGFSAMVGAEYEFFNFAETPQSLGREEGRGAHDDHAGDVRLLAAAREPEPRILQCAHGRLRRRSASRSRGCTPRPGPVSTRLRSSSHRRSRPPTARCSSRPRPRRSAALRDHADRSWRSGARNIPAAPATCTRACPMERRISSTIRKGAMAACRRLFESYLAGQCAVLMEHGADVLAHDELVQATGRRILGAGEAHLGRG